MKKRVLILFVYSILMFISFSNVVSAKNVTIDELVTAIGKSKVGVVETPPFEPDKVYIITSCTYSAKKTTNGFSYSPSCMVQNVTQPTGDIDVSYNKDNNTISFSLKDVEFVGGHTDYMHYWIAEALGITNVKETIDNSQNKNSGCDLLNTGYCQENGIITYELSDKNYNYILKGAPSIGEPPLPDEEKIKEELENTKKEFEEYIDFADKTENESDLKTEEDKTKYLLGTILKQTKITVTDDGLDFTMDSNGTKLNAHIKYDGKAYSYDYNNDSSSIVLGGVAFQTLMMMMAEKSNISYDDLALVLDSKEEFFSGTIGDYTKNGFEAQYIHEKETSENSSTEMSFLNHFKISSEAINLIDVPIVSDNDGKGTNGTIEPDIKDDDKKTDNGIENPNTGYGVIALILGIVTTSFIILSSKHRKYYKI